MSNQVIVSFLRFGRRHVLVNKNGQLVKINTHSLQKNFINSLRGNIIFLDTDLPNIPLYSHNKILQSGFLVFACKITDFYCQNTEKQALVLLIQENYRPN